MPHTVLLVDDEPNVLAGLQRCLRREPYQTVRANVAPVALDILRRMTVDAVVADHDMPGMRGTEFLAIVRHEFPTTARFILTGKATLAIAIEAVNTGAIGHFFTKPCNPTDLATTLRQAIQHRTQMLENKRLLRLAEIEQLAQKTPEVFKVLRHRDRKLYIAPDDIRFDEVLLALHGEEEKNVYLVCMQNGKVSPGTVSAIHDTHLVVDTPHSTAMRKPGETIMVVFPTPSQEQYVLYTSVQEVYVHRLKLHYSAHPLPT